jgi:hypothetical protein
MLVRGTGIEPVSVTVAMLHGVRLFMLHKSRGIQPVSGTQTRALSRSKQVAAAGHPKGLPAIGPRVARAGTAPLGIDNSVIADQNHPLQSPQPEAVDGLKSSCPCREVAVHTAWLLMGRPPQIDIGACRLSSRSAAAQSAS